MKNSWEQSDFERKCQSVKKNKENTNIHTKINAQITTFLSEYEYYILQLLLCGFHRNYFFYNDAIVKERYKHTTIEWTNKNENLLESNLFRFYKITLLLGRNVY